MDGRRPALRRREQDPAYRSTRPPRIAQRGWSSSYFFHRRHATHRGSMRSARRLASEKRSHQSVLPTCIWAFFGRLSWQHHHHEEPGMSDEELEGTFWFCLKHRRVERFEETDSSSRL